MRKSTRRKVVPRLEQLEDRITPADLTAASLKIDPSVLNALPNAAKIAKEAEQPYAAVLNRISDAWNQSSFAAILSQELAALAQTPLGQSVEQTEQQFARLWAIAEGTFDSLFPVAGHPLDGGTSEGGSSHPDVSPNSLTPGGDPPIPFVEGTSPSQQLITTFTDADANTDPSKYSANVNWGDNQSSAGTVQYSNGQFQVWAGHTYADEGNYPISVSILDSDNTQTSATAGAAVSDAPLTPGSVSSISATAGQNLTNVQLVSFTDANASASASDFTVDIDWGDGQITPGTVTSQGNGSFSVSGSHLYELPGGYGINVAINDVGGSETSASTSATVAASTTNPAAYNDAYSVNHDSTLSISAANGVLANDTDPNNLPLTAVLAGNADHGSLQFNSDGSFTYVPATGYVGTDSFSYYATDGQYNSNVATVTLTIDSTISGQVWLDGNQDGIENNGESGMSGVLVNLILADGSTATSTTTDSNGNYVLSVDPSWGTEFQVQVTIPSGDSATIPFASQSGSVSSIDDAGYSNVLTLLPSGISNVNAGIASGSGPLASVSGEVWLDGNDNGILDSGESGLSDVNVNLLNSNWAVVDSTVTDDNGDYSFLGLSPNTPYTVQFVGPNGYVFSPQNVGSPSTSSSADPNGLTNSITLSPGQSDTTVNAGLYGSAPIVYQTSISMLAVNDTNSGIDFTGDGYSPGGATLTPIIVQGPTQGTLTYDSSTGLYDYAAPSNFTGIDSFQFQLSDGHTVSAVVTVQILAYSGDTPPAGYDSFPLFDSALYVGNGGNPNPSSVEQGAFNDCWLVAAAASAAEMNPAKITSLIKDNGNGTFTVSFPGHAAVTVGFAGDTHDYSTANGDWLKVLEKAYATMRWDEDKNRPTPLIDPIWYVDQPAPCYTGIRVLVQHGASYGTLSTWTIGGLKRNLQLAFSGDRMVVVGTGGGATDQVLKDNGLDPHHDYAVLGYDPTAGKIQLYNPHHENREFNKDGDAQFFLGKKDPEQPAPPALPNNNGYFWMKLSDFKRFFGSISIEAPG